MSNTAIKVENLSKIYRLGEIGTGTISRDMERWFKTRILKQEDPFLKIGETNDRANKGASDIVYSLQNINFEINQGDAVGIIGRNGAGKSTLLKILSRVTTPTTGKINIKGRAASLLEVGTGFHPELTGRENIYLNGAILGMRKREIDRKFDEIVDFSGVERYIDTPVKRYSSGMYVRLAFAVAAHLESEILIVDEVLAVGDAEFQKKCLGKMGDISKGEGRTVLFVSHNMAAIKSLCNNAIILHKGVNLFNGEVMEGISKYVSFDVQNQDSKTSFQREGNTAKKMFIESANLLDDPSKEIFEICLKIIIYSNFESKASLNLTLIDGMGFPIAYGCSHYRLPQLYNILKGSNEIFIKSQPINLGIGTYKINIELVDPGYEFFDIIENAISFEVSPDEIANRKYGIMQNWGKGSIELLID
jgi:lipopolysaccharide transport system ATP-binding protein